MDQLAQALEERVGRDGAVPAGVAALLHRERGWRGRLMEVLEVLTEDTQTMAYLAGGRRPDEVMTWLAPWVECPLSLDQIRLVVSLRGWDPEPFVVLARAGLLETVLLTSDGLPRKIRGELAGGWVSDELALADDEEVLRQVRQVLENETVATRGG